MNCCLSAQAPLNYVNVANRKSVNGMKQFWELYCRHSDLIKNCETLVLTTFVLASKIFSSIPPVIANLSLAILKYTSILFINSQVMHLQKSLFDLGLAIRFVDWEGMILTTSKVAVKAANIFLTFLGFAMPIAGLLGFAGMASSFYAILIPVSRSFWLLGCLNEISDYFQNRGLRSALQKLNPQCLQKLVIDFKALTNQTPHLYRSTTSYAVRLIRQCEGSTLEIFIQAQGKNKSIATDQQVQILIKEFQYSLEKKNSLTESGALLSTLGYASMHISKLYPDGAIEWGLRWSMSFLYLLKSIDKKFFQAELEKRIADV